MPLDLIHINIHILIIFMYYNIAYIIYLYINSKYIGRKLS